MKNKIKSSTIFYISLLMLIYAAYAIIYSDIPVENLKQKYTNEHSKFISIDNMQVHYRDEGAGKTIVLIHGTAASLHTWDDWTKTLTNNYRVIRMDLPAFGLTGANANGDYSITNYTRFLKQFLSKLNVENFYLVGNSLGGNIAWNFTAENPEKVEKLILIDSSGLPINQPIPWIFSMAKMPILSSLFLHVTPRMIIKNNITQVYSDDSKITEDLITRYHEMSLRAGNRQAFIDRANITFRLASQANINKLKSIKTETLLLWGEDDVWIPLDNGKRMNSLLDNSTLVVLKNSGHVPMEESPQESMEVMLGFIQ